MWPDSLLLTLTTKPWVCIDLLKKTDCKIEQSDEYCFGLWQFFAQAIKIPFPPIVTAQIYKKVLMFCMTSWTG